MKNKPNVLYYFLGIATAVLFYVLYTCINLNMEKHAEVDNAAVVETTENEVVEMTASADDEVEPEETVVDYELDRKDWLITCSDGTQLQCFTPDTMYSLSDQYLDMLGSAYGNMNLKSDGFVVVGDQTSPSSCNYIINAATLSATADLLTQLSGTETTIETMEMSEAYIYMTTGKLPDGVDDSFAIAELENFKVNDVNYKVYKISYDYEYTVSENAAPEVEHIEQLVCYSDNADSLEIYVAAQNFNEDVAKEMLHAFVGYTQ